MSNQQQPLPITFSRVVDFLANLKTNYFAHDFPPICGYYRNTMRSLITWPFCIFYRLIWTLRKERFLKNFDFQNSSIVPPIIWCGKLQGMQRDSRYLLFNECWWLKLWLSQKTLVRWFNFLVYIKPGGQTEHTETVIDADFRIRLWHYKYPIVKGFLEITTVMFFPFHLGPHGYVTPTPYYYRTETSQCEGLAYHPLCGTPPTANFFANEAACKAKWYDAVILMYLLTVSFNFWMIQSLKNSS